MYSNNYSTRPPGRGLRLAQMVAATVALGRLASPAKAAKRSDWCGGLKGAVAIACHRPVAPPFGRTKPRRLRFRAGVNEASVRVSEFNHTRCFEGSDVVRKEATQHLEVSRLCRTG
jgi:hypothetical protein